MLCVARPLMLPICVKFDQFTKAGSRRGSVSTSAASSPFSSSDISSHWPSAACPPALLLLAALLLLLPLPPPLPTRSRAADYACRPMVAPMARPPPPGVFAAGEVEVFCRELVLLAGGAVFDVAAAADLFFPPFLPVDITWTAGECGGVNRGELGANSPGFAAARRSLAARRRGEGRAHRTELRRVEVNN